MIANAVHTMPILEMCAQIGCVILDQLYFAWCLQTVL